MSKYYFITGTSSGIGRALALYILDIDHTAKVIGYARRNTINHERYQHINIDLSHSESLYHCFDKFIEKDIKEVFLINNAATLGEIGYIGELESQDIEQAVQVNITAPFILMNEFLKTFESYNSCIVNVQYI